MKALSLVEPHHFEVVDRAEPELGPEDVLVAPRYIGCCGTDLSSYRGTMPLTNYPTILGHEVSGVIIAKGKKVPARIQENARVMLNPYQNCGLCPACRVGRVNACQFNQTMGVQRDGAMTECVAAHYTKVYTSDMLSFQELALVEPLSVGYHAANRGRVSETDTVLVLGCGAVGLGAIAASARKGATVIALDLDEGKLEQAKRFGADYTINSTRENPQESVDALTNLEGVNVAIEAAGLPETTRLAIELAASVGRVVFIGWAKEEIALQTPFIVRKELDVVGSRNSLHVFPAVIKMLEARERPFTSIISSVVSLEETPRAFADWDAAPQQFAKIMVEIPTK